MSVARIYSMVVCLSLISLFSPRGNIDLAHSVNGLHLIKKESIFANNDTHGAWRMDILSRDIDKISAIGSGCEACGLFKLAGHMTLLGKSDKGTYLG